MGRPKGVKTQEEKREALRSKLFTTVNAKRLTSVLKRLLDLTDDDNPKVALKAIEQLLDRLLGAPESSASVKVSGLTSPGNRILLAALGDEKMIKAGQELAELVSKKLSEGSSL